ncbi:hypothetical protein DPMN_135453 [Dreissena polymorpha]|uniref:Uncharacterized protein n=1 Tax=Dreissena polymorpha TaxID=45954 RepID=A0A9D4G1X8_DREPO|nr:hypothetical protein DPMN_135453 [Dreissena polymorpha]
MEVCCESHRGQAVHYQPLPTCTSSSPWPEMDPALEYPTGLHVTPADHYLPLSHT